MRYNRKWQELSQAIRTKYPLCCACITHDESQPRLATEVHHLMPVKVAPEHELTIPNLCPVCRECHERLEVLANRKPMLVLHPELVAKRKDTCNESLNAQDDRGGANPLIKTPCVTSQAVFLHEFPKNHPTPYDFAKICSDKSAVLIKTVECHATNDGFYCKKLNILRAIPCPHCARNAKMGL